MAPAHGRARVALVCAPLAPKGKCGVATPTVRNQPQEGRRIVRPQPPAQRQAGTQWTGRRVWCACGVCVGGGAWVHGCVGACVCGVGAAVRHDFAVDAIATLHRKAAEVSHHPAEARVRVRGCGCGGVLCGCTVCVRGEGRGRGACLVLISPFAGGV